MCDKSDELLSKTKDSMENNSNVIEATFKHLARINGEINKMNTKELIEKLKYYSLDTEGNDNVRRRRLKNNYRRMKLAPLDINLSNKILPFYVVMDFEATCLGVNNPEYQHEIIEFPAVLINGVNQEVEDTFHMFCKPVINPVLTDFCIELTGITQEQVDSAETFENVFRCFELWLRDHIAGGNKKFAIVTDGPWDMCRFLYQQCQFSQVQYPNWGKKWVNLKRSFGNFYKCDRRPLKDMLNYLEMDFVGRLHSGLDDAKNIARLLIRMIRDGANVQPNEKITDRPPQYIGTDSRFIRKIENNDNDDSCDKMDNSYVRAYYQVIEKKDRLLTYDKVRREKKKIESKMNKEIKEKEEMEGIPEWISKETVTGNKKTKRKWKKLDLRK